MCMSIRVTVAALALAAVAAPSGAQTLVGRADSVYTWRGQIAAGRTLQVKNFNGPIDVRGTTGTTAELRAEKRTERGGGALSDVEFEVQDGRGTGDVTICAVSRGRNPCDDRGWNDDSDDRGWRRNVTVAMTILVPKGTQVKIGTGNGAISIEQVSGDISAASGNGRVHVTGAEGTVRVSSGNGDIDVRDSRSQVRVSTGNGRVTVGTVEGPVEARTGNGDIEVSMSKLRGNQDMEFHTGSGSVRVTLPAGFNGELDASTGNGEISSDFDLKLSGSVNPRRIHATIGTGGSRLRMTTGNGRLELRKAG